MYESELLVMHEAQRRLYKREFFEVWLGTGFYMLHIRVNKLAAGWVTTGNRGYSWTAERAESDMKRIPK